MMQYFIKMAASEHVQFSLFHDAIEKIVLNWSAMQLALDHGMGGSEGNEIVHWMIGVIEQFFTENDNLEADEVADFIAEIVNNEFNTIIEDGSLTQISEKLCHFYGLMQKGHSDELQKLIQSLPVVNVEGSTGFSSETSESNDRSEKSSQSITRQLDDLQLNSNAETKTMEEDIPEEDGWTVVHRGKRK